MKKFLSGIFGTLLFAAALLGAAACGEEPSGGANAPDLEVVAPDGAPALALCYAIEEEEKRTDDVFDFEIVDAGNIQTYVNPKNPEADLAVLPVNLAAKLLGTGAVYQMLGTVTNGNLYFLTAGADLPALTAANLKESLVGKKLGVVQLGNVPGLTLQVVLNNYGIPYQTIESSQAEADPEKVNLVAYLPPENDFSPISGCDYYLAPEPAASAKIKGTANGATPFRMAGDLQELYGGGYPQAVVVAKKTVIETRADDLETFLGYLEGSAGYLKTVSVETALKLLADVRVADLTPSFNANNLTAEVIGRCSVSFTASKACKEKVTAFLDKLIRVKADAAAAPDDAFFYLG